MYASYRIKPSLDPEFIYLDVKSYGGDAPIWKWVYDSPSASKVLDRVVNSVITEAS